MAVVNLTGAFRFLCSVDTQENRGDFFQRCASVIGVQKTHVKLQMVTVIDRHGRVVRRCVGDRELAGGDRSPCGSGALINEPETMIDASAGRLKFPALAVTGSAGPPQCRVL